MSYLEIIEIFVKKFGDGVLKSSIVWENMKIFNCYVSL